MCAACGDHQFARNDTCRKCGADKPAGMPQTTGQHMMNNMMQNPMMQQMMMQQMMQYMGGMGGMGGMMGGQGGGGNMMNAKMGMGGGMGGNKQQMKPGDWNCPSCGDLQFARNL